jgi:hypothetical protein
LLWRSRFHAHLAKHATAAEVISAGARPVVGKDKIKYVLEALAAHNVFDVIGKNPYPHINC